MIRVIFTNGLTAICHHVIPEMRLARSIYDPTTEIEKCFVTLHFTKNATQEYEAKEISRIEGVNLKPLI